MVVKWLGDKYFEACGLVRSVSLFVMIIKEMHKVASLVKQFNCNILILHFIYDETVLCPRKPSWVS